MKKYRYFIIPVIICFIAFGILNTVVNKQYEEIINTKDMAAENNTYGLATKDKGLALKEEIFKSNDIVLMGSSELGANVEQNTRKFYPTKEMPYNISVFGRAYTQSLQMASILNTTESIDSNDKVVIILSLQWFQGEGLTREGFDANFSDKQFYKIMNDKTLTKEHKKYYAKRVSELLKKSSTHSEEQIYATLYSKDNVLTDTALVLLKPYYWVKEKLLNTKDKYEVIKELKDNSEKKNNSDYREIDWNKEVEKATNQGKEATTNNDLAVDNSYYDKYLRANLEGRKGSLSNETLMNSKEFEDYKHLLDVCEKKGIKPLIVITPVNGKYYDHLGLTRETRIRFYDKIDKLAKEKGFEVLNYKDKDYEEYFLVDVMHLGWKGWTDINYEITNYFKSK